MQVKRLFVFLAWFSLIGVGALLGGCRSDKTSSAQAPKATTRPTLRIITLGGAAGAIEPCGCVTDMLGGVDHAAALVRASQKSAGGVLVLGAGSMFFQDPLLAPEVVAQAELKAETLAHAMKDFGLFAWAPGANDWARDVPAFTQLTRSSGALALAENLDREAGVERGFAVVERGGLKVGVVGISLPAFPGRELGFSVGEAKQALRRGLGALKNKGAELSIALIAAPRGEALRLVESAPELAIAVVGKPFDQGEDNDEPSEPMLLGRTLVVQGQNHLQGAPVIDLFVRDNQPVFQDGSGLREAQQRASLSRRIEQLEQRLAASRHGADSGSQAVPGVEELASLKRELAAIKLPEPPSRGSYFLYDFTFIKESLGQDPNVSSRLVAYYKRVNEMNRERFKEKRPEPAPASASSYVGVEQCSICHQEERKFWDTTPHAGAYETLAKDHKQFNLDCVSCHVTGYEKPGGSTVTHVEGLQSVQCENCHGPGSRHVTSPADSTLITRLPARSVCVGCHHPPHVTEEWSVDQAFPHVLGPGHGMPAL